MSKKNSVHRSCQHAWSAAPQDLNQLMIRLECRAKSKNVTDPTSMRSVCEERQGLKPVGISVQVPKVLRTGRIDEEVAGECSQWPRIREDLLFSDAQQCGLRLAERTRTQ